MTTTICTSIREDFYGPDEEQREVRCRDCNSDDVYWAQNNAGRWALYDVASSRVHRCKSEIVTERRLDAFDNLD